MPLSNTWRTTSGQRRSGSTALSAGPVKTLAASAVGDSDKLAGLYEMSSPLERNITREEVGAAGMFLLSDHRDGDLRRNPPRRLRLQRDGLTRPRDREGQGADPRESQGGQPRALAAAARKGRASSSAYERARRAADPGRYRHHPPRTTVSWSGNGRRGPSTPDTGNSPGASASRAKTRPRPTARECLEETGLAVVVGPLRRVTTYRYPHGLVKLHFYDCTTEDARRRACRRLGLSVGARPINSPRCASRKPTRRSSQSWPAEQL